MMPMPMAKPKAAGGASHGDVISAKAKDPTARSRVPATTSQGSPTHLSSRRSSQVWVKNWPTPKNPRSSPTPRLMACSL